ncbi:MAG: DUF1385 domain-containing protein [Lachnospiraceae bacterium]|nr:DUF1385 domain-containing protein [Lachnospiraceae bacterium]
MAEKTGKRYCGIGGQAVLEGVMMKNKDKYAVAVRKPDGEIQVKVDEYKASSEKKKLFGLPFVRGIFNFYDSLVLGIGCLNYSASFYEDEEKEETAVDKAVNKVSDGKSEAVFSALTVIFSLLVAIAIFMVLPYYLAELLKVYVRNESLVALLEAVLRILIFLIYVVAISFMQDIRRVYMYHGAEHKCINCIERGRELNVENVRKSSRQHKRCGTSFLLFVVFISAVLFFFIRVDSALLRVGLRILLIPVIAGIAYEVIRLAGRSDNVLVQILSAPGMLLQKLTTKEPDDDMIEVAIASVEAVFDWKQYFKDTFSYDVDRAASVREASEVIQQEIEEEELAVENEEEEEETSRDEE